MNIKIFITIFLAVFLAELGDKTQLATILFASDNNVSKLTVFAAAATALVATSAIGVLMGSVISQYITGKQLSYIAGTGFIIIGIYTIITAS